MRIFSRPFLWCLSVLCVACTFGKNANGSELNTDTLDNKSKERLLILTDINSLRPHFLEADDAQSLIRLMLYGNEFDLEGFVVSSKMKKGLMQQTQLVHEIIDAYEKVQPNLLKHDPAYPTAEALRKMVKKGQANEIPTGTDPIVSFGEGRDTEGSDWIIRVVDNPDPRPVWINIWGGAADLAQAIWKVKQTRSESDVQSFIKKMRVRAISDQDSTGAWIIKNFPAIWYVEYVNLYQGIYKGGDKKLTDSLWVVNNIHHKDNPLGRLYPNYYYGPKSVIRGVKEGDTPCFLSMIPNGLNISDQPELGGWGGAFTRVGANFYKDDIDRSVQRNESTTYYSSVYNWRAAFQADFAARLLWCTKPYNEANHAPQVVVNSDASKTPLVIDIAAGKSVQLNAKKSSDPDGNALSFHWQVYPGTLPSSVTLSNANSDQLEISIKTGAAAMTLPVLLTVTDNGQPAMRSYRRILLNVKAK